MTVNSRCDSRISLCKYKLIVHINLTNIYLNQQNIFDFLKVFTNKLQIIEMQIHKNIEISIYVFYVSLKKFHVNKLSHYTSVMIIFFSDL